MPFLVKQSLIRFAARQWLAMTLTLMMAVPPSCGEKGRVETVITKAKAAGPPVAESTALTTGEPGRTAPNNSQQEKGPLTCQSRPEADANSLLAINDVTDPKGADEWGSITVAQPKIWQFERMSALLDGLLRDIEGVSLSDLTQLDPNAQNAAAVKFVQSALEVGVQYDQAAAITNSINRSNYQLQAAAAQKRFEADNAYIDLLSQERNLQTAQLMAAQNTVNQLQPLADAKTISDAQQKDLDTAKSRVTALTSSLAGINDAIGKASLSSLAAAPTLSNTSVQAPASGIPTNTALSSYSDLLKSLPQGAQDNLSSALKAPSLPATKRMDNFITLLYERLAREVSALQDDLTRNPENVPYLVQFDVGVYPSKKAKNHNARVEFQINCPNCKVYSLYPGQSSYNIANYASASKRTTIWGNVLTLLGFGASASYRRQVDTLQGGLVQSVYTVGFQSGVKQDNEGRTKTREMPDGASAVQSFGWYYGAAPFEESVSPGIRSTFAVVTVPREDVDKARDIFGNSDACMPFHITSAWARRDDPMRQRESESPVGKVGRELISPLYNWTDSDFTTRKGAPLFPKQPLSSISETATSVKLPGAPEAASIVAKRERDILHVVRMEYNTIFEESADSAAGSARVATASATSASTALGTPAGASSVSSSSGSSITSVVQTNVPPAPCPLGKCAGMLLKLDRPIDPNLIITVRGEPLKRVRDWRGRATSVLPPAQSGTDLSSQATSNGELGAALIKHLRSSRSLLETDDAEPNSWFVLSSTEIFLNISKELATNDEFPVIQLTEPSHTVIIPHDLRKGTTDLIVNGLHMRPQSDRTLEHEFLASYASNRAVKAFQWYKRYDEPAELGDDSPVTSGPYPYTTFIPLFLPDNPPEKFYARLGETKDDLLVGFVSRPAVCGDPVRRCVRWSEGHTQVILEDRDLDFAWSLSCFVQADELACHLPRPAIQQVYGSYVKVCIDDRFCPGAKESALPLQRSFAKFLTSPGKDKAGDKKDSGGEADSIGKHPSGDSGIDDMRRKIRDVSRIVGTPRTFAEKLSKLSESTLQVWVVQSDTVGGQVFYSAEPARIDFFPLSDEYWSKGTLKPWHFKDAKPDTLSIEGCNYFPQDIVNGDLQRAPLGHVALLGSLFPPKRRNLVPETEKDFLSCQTFDIPTIALTRDQLVFNVQADNDQGAGEPYPAPFLIPTHKLAPSFSKPTIRTNFSTASGTNPLTLVQITGWTLEFTVTRSIPSDTLEPPGGPNNSGMPGLKVEWLSGTTELRACDGKEGRSPTGDTCRAKSAPDSSWEAADQVGALHLRLTVPREMYQYLSQELTLVRHSTQGDIAVARLPNLRKLLFPTRLTIQAAGSNQFLLRGERAEAMDVVSMVNDDGTVATLQAARGRNVVLFHFKVAKQPDSSPGDGSASKSGTNNGSAKTSTQISVVTSKDHSNSVKLTQDDSEQPKSGTANNGSGSTQESKADSATPSTELVAGTYTVVPLVQVAGPSDDDVKNQKKARDEAIAAQKDLTAKQKKAEGKDKNSPEAKAVAAAQQKLKTATAAAEKIDAETQDKTRYMALDVTDDKGDPLTFTIPEAKKAAAPKDTTSTPSATCATPCVAVPCVVTCAQSATGAKQ